MGPAASASPLVATLDTNMIRIFNSKLNVAIEIDESFPQVGFSPRHYEIDNPHVRIMLPGIDFFRHSDNCADCAAFKAAFGSDSIDWFISFLDKTYRLDLRKFSSHHRDNLASRKNSADFYGTELKFNLDISTIDDLKSQLAKELISENYEKCSILRDKISILS
jgi:hypothetical protein